MPAPILPTITVHTGFTVAHAKHTGKSFDWIAKNDSAYCKWAMSRDADTHSQLVKNEPTWSTELHAFRGFLDSQQSNVGCSYVVSAISYFIALVHGLLWEISIFGAVDIATVYRYILLYTMLVSYQMCHVILHYIAHRSTKPWINSILVTVTWVLGLCVSWLCSNILLQTNATVCIHTVIFFTINCLVDCTCLTHAWVQLTRH